MGRKLAAFLFMGAGVLLICASIALLMYNRLEDRGAGAAADEVLPYVQEVIAVQEENTSEDEMLRKKYLSDDEMTVAEIDGYGYIGYLSIPAYELELPIMAEWDYPRLRIAPCRYSGSPRSEEFVIAGHNYSRHFGNLKNLNEGELILFTDMDGISTAYRVEIVEILQPTEIERMIEPGWGLTLFTCTYGGKSRVTVRCSRVE